ncbi:uncharacterized protein LOC136758547 isoform X2 [Amia ocellicauda]|uniref:uncharacterized protein LOC136758547 isoform X2 n=1 Tax=Amia ocellicauda TaxID=2972642 RepID=UPI003464C57B
MSSSSKDTDNGDNQSEDNNDPNMKSKNEINKHVGITTLDVSTSKEPSTPEKSIEEWNEPSSDVEFEVYTGFWSHDELEDEANLNEFQKKMLAEHRQAISNINRGCVIMERNRRKRITISCNNLRQLLPKLSGWRTDMVTVLEMTVTYLELIQEFLPAHQHRTMLYPPKELCNKWHAERQLKREQCRKVLSEEVGRQRVQCSKKNRAGQGKSQTKCGFRRKQNRKGSSLKKSKTKELSADQPSAGRESETGVVNHQNTADICEHQRITEGHVEKEQTADAGPQDSTASVSRPFVLDYGINCSPEVTLPTCTPSAISVVTPAIPGSDSSFSWPCFPTPVRWQTAPSLSDSHTTPQINCRFQPPLPQEKTPISTIHQIDWEGILEGEQAVFGDSVSLNPSAAAHSNA